MTWIIEPRSDSMMLMTTICGNWLCFFYTCCSEGCFCVKYQPCHHYSCGPIYCFGNTEPMD
jgi:hypothetical protein